MRHSVIPDFINYSGITLSSEDMSNFSHFHILIKDNSRQTGSRNSEQPRKGELLVINNPLSVADTKFPQSNPHTQPSHMVSKPSVSLFSTSLPIILNKNTSIIAPIILMSVEKRKVQPRDFWVSRGGRRQQVWIKMAEKTGQQGSRAVNKNQVSA